MATTNYHKAKVRLHTRQSNQPDTRLPLRCLLVPPLSLHSEPRRHKFVHRNLDLRRSTNVHRVLSAAATSKRDHVCCTNKEKDATQCNATQGTSKQASKYVHERLRTNEQHHTPPPPTKNACDVAATAANHPTQQPTTPHHHHHHHRPQQTTNDSNNNSSNNSNNNEQRRSEPKPSEPKPSEAKRSEAKPK